MRYALVGRWWHLLVLSMFLTGTVFATSPIVTLYPYWGATINGKPVYVSALLSMGDRVRTADGVSRLTVNTVELDIAPHSSMVIGEPLVLNRGTLTVRSGTIAIMDGVNVASVTAGQSAHAALPATEDELPDTPSAAQSAQEESWFRRLHRTHPRDGAASSATAGVLRYDSEVADWSYWTIQGTMFTSSVFAVEKTHTCLQAGACSFVPDTLHRRAVMYTAGLPIEAGVSYLSYYLKARHHRWWFVPAALVTAGNVVVSAHAAKYSH